MPEPNSQKSLCGTFVSEQYRKQRELGERLQKQAQANYDGWCIYFRQLLWDGSPRVEEKCLN